MYIEWVESYSFLYIFTKRRVIFHAGNILNMLLMIWLNSLIIRVILFDIVVENSVGREERVYQCLNKVNIKTMAFLTWEER